MGNNAFGPWTTSLGHPTDARLSSFWQRRMKLLPVARAANCCVSNRSRIALAICLAVTGAAPLLQLTTAQEPTAAQQPDPRLQGSWKLVFGRDGRIEIKELQLTFRGDRVTIDDQERPVSIEFRTDVTQQPHTIDLLVPDGGGEGKFRVDKGIYELRDGHLVFCLNESEEGDRPTEFKSGTPTQDADLVLCVMARVTRPETAAVGDQSTKMTPGENPAPEFLKQLTFGPPATNGLRAALVIDPVRSTYKIGDLLDASIVIQNSGTEAVQFSSEKVRQGGLWQVFDSEDNRIQASTMYISIWPVYSQFRLEPGQIVTLYTHGLILNPHVATQNVRKSGAKAVIRAKPGEALMISYEFNLPGGRVEGAQSEEQVPRPGDWEGNLTTGTITLQVVATDQANNDKLLDAPEDKPATTPPATTGVRNKQSSTSKPWTVFGRVTDVDGKPVAGAKVRAATGVGTLLGGGTTTTDTDGKYRLSFGPGISIQGQQGYVQAAAISAGKQGYFEKNLSRQGDCVAALSPNSNEPIDLSKLDTWAKPHDRVFLPDVPKEIDFVLSPAARVAGRLVDTDGKPLKDYSVSLTGIELPPASSVIAQVRTDAVGRFSIQDIPTTYPLQFQINPPKRRDPPWRVWSSRPMSFQDPGSGDFRAVVGDQDTDHPAILVAQEFELQLVGPGTSRKKSLEQAAQEKQARYHAQEALKPPTDGGRTLECKKLQFFVGDER